jgi:hypothetical protein
MTVNLALGETVFKQACQEAWNFGPVPETGPAELDTGEEILALLAKLACLLPMQRSRLMMMEIPDYQRSEQRKWLEKLSTDLTRLGAETAYHQHNLRKAGYGKQTSG